MNTLDLLLSGLGSVLSSPGLLLAAGIGCLLGTVVGILPGLGPSTTMALLIPVALNFDPATALILVTAVYLGAMYGGTLTSVLLNVPGEPSSAITALDGFQMARQGRAGAALAVAAIGSFVGGVVSIIGLAALAMPLANLALRFGPSEYFAVIVLALVLSATLVGSSVLKGALAICIGLLLATVGTDLQTGVPKFTFGMSGLLDGIDMIIPIIGVFGIGEVFWLLAHPEPATGGGKLKISGRLWPTREDRRRSRGAVGRGTVIGFVAGLLPGSGSTMASFMSYSVEKRVSRSPERFGKGAVEGVAAAETANNASTGGALAPMLTLGIPGSGATAVLLAYLIMYGIQPGPAFFTQHSVLAWTLVASLLVSNVILLFLNLPLIPLFVRLLDVPNHVMLPGILLVALIGAYSASNSLFDAGLVVFFGVVGYLLRLAGMSPALLVVGVVLGESLEPRLRQAVSIYDGDLLHAIFNGPLSITIFVVAALVLGADTLSGRVRRRKKVKVPVTVDT